MFLALSSMNLIDSGLSIGGLVLGIVQTSVNPPIIAALAPEEIVSLSSHPGSRKWTCKSQNP